jgi:hypothetical protein
MRRFSITAVMVLVIPAFAVAQHPGAVGAVASAGAHAPSTPSRPATAIPRAAPAHGNTHVQSGAQSAVRANPSGMRGQNTGHSGHRGNSAQFGSSGTDFQNVPGLGFDYPHLAAISGNRQMQDGRFDRGSPFGFSGFLLTSPIFAEDAPAAEPQAPTTQDEVADDAPDVQRSPRHSRAPRVASEPEAQTAPSPQGDVEQYVFVRRDGGLVFAVAYAWENETLRYVTPEGLRRSIGRDALDLNATQQFNEQRGLNFRGPA